MNIKIPKLNLLPKKIISIDIGSYETKITEGKVNKKGIVIDKYFSFLMPEGVYENGYIIDSELLYYLLKEELKRNNVNSKIVYMSIKSSNIITREVVLPYLRDEEIEGILQFQLDEYLPIDPKDYIVQYKTIGKFIEDGTDKINVLLIAVPKEIVEAHFQLISELELKPLVLDYQSDSLVKLLDYNSLINGKYSTKDITIATIDLGFTNTNVTISKNGQILVSRIVETGGNELDMSILNFFELNKNELEEKKRTIENINRIEGEFTEENRFLNIINSNIESIMDKIDIIFRYYYSREKDNVIHLILLTGGLSNISGIENLFSKYFNISTIRLNSFDKVFFSFDLNKYVNCISSLIRIGEQ